MNKKNKNRNKAENTNSEVEVNETTSISDAENNETPSIQNAEQELPNSFLADRIAGKVDEQGNKINAEDENA